MEKDKHETKVVFRVWRAACGKAQGTVLALFPDIDEGRGQCSSYEHIGQHGGADYVGCVAATRPAKPEEYADLARELEGLGYKLKIRMRR